MKYGLTEETIQKIRSVFVRFPEIDKAVLYGSRAKGNYKPGSDIDLTLYGATLTLDLCASIAETLDDLLLPYTIDLSLFDELDHAKLREHIERVGVTFYERADNDAAAKKGWDVKELGDIASVKGGKRVPKGYKLQSEKTKFPYITVSDFNDNGSIDLKDIRYISEEVFEQIKNYTISTNDLYISIAGTIGKTGIIPAEH